MDRLIPLIKMGRELSESKGVKSLAEQLKIQEKIDKISEKIYYIIDNPYEIITLHVCAGKRFGQKGTQNYDIPEQWPVVGRLFDESGVPGLKPKVSHTMISISDYKKLKIPPEMRQHEVLTKLSHYKSSICEDLHSVYGYFQDDKFVELTNTDLETLHLVGLLTGYTASGIRKWFNERNIQVQVIGYGPLASSYEKRDPPVYLSHARYDFAYMEYKVVILSQFEYADYDKIAG